MVSCVTDDKKRLPLLGVFGLWIKGVAYLSLSQGQAIADTLTARCTEVGVDEADIEVDKAIKLLRRSENSRPAAVPAAERPDQDAETATPAEAAASAPDIVDK